MSTGGYPPDPPLPPPGGPDPSSFGQFAAQIKACLDRAQNALGPLSSAIGELDPAARSLSVKSVGATHADLHESVAAIMTSAGWAKEARRAAEAGIERGWFYLRTFGS